MNTPKSFILAIGLTLVILLPACTPSQAELDATATQVAANAFATQTAQAPLATPTEAPIPTASPSIIYDPGISGVVLPTKDEPRWLQDEAVFRKAGLMPLFSQGDSAKEKANVEALISQGIRVLIICPVDETAATAAAEEAKAAGVKVISYDRLIRDTDAVDYYVTFDSVAVGEAWGDYLIQQAGTTRGNPLYLYAGAPFDNSTFLFFEGVWNKLQPKIADGMFVIKNSREAMALKDKPTLTRDEEARIINQVTTKWDPNIAKSLAQSNLKHAEVADKGTVFILAPADIVARAIADVFAADKDVIRYYITGQDAEKASIQYIIDGKQSMTVLKDVRTLAYDAVKAATAYLAGSMPVPTVTYYNGKIDVPSKPSALVTVTRDNVKQAIIDSGYYPATDFTVIPIATAMPAVTPLAPTATLPAGTPVPNWPTTVSQAVQNIKSRLSEQDVEWIRRNPKQDIVANLNLEFGMRIRNEFGLWGHNQELLGSCGVDQAEECSAIILGQLWDTIWAETDPQLAKALDCQLQALDLIKIDTQGFYQFRIGEVLDSIQAQIDRQLEDKAYTGCARTIRIVTEGPVNLECWTRYEFEERQSLRELLNWISWRNAFDVRNDPPELKFQFREACAWPEKPKFFAPAGNSTPASTSVATTRIPGSAATPAANWCAPADVDAFTAVAGGNAGANWAVISEFVFPATSWSAGEHTYTFWFEPCQYSGELPDHLTRSFVVTNEARVYDSPIYFGPLGPSNSDSAYGPLIEAIHPAQPTIARLNDIQLTQTEAEAVVRECVIWISWDDGERHQLVPRAPCQYTR